MEIQEMADRLVQIFGLNEAKIYVILWQDEYTNEKDKIFRQKVKDELSNR